MRRATIALAVIVLLIWVIWLLNTKTGAPESSAKYTTGFFGGCPPEGSGGDSELNRLKNRDLAPPAYYERSISQILAKVPHAAIEIGRTDRGAWPAQALDSVSAWENQGAVVTGYLIAVKQEGPESCNCKAQDQRDFHLWLTESPEEDRSTFIIAEISPRLLPSHPNWHLRILKRLAKDRAKLRLRGWMMWDQEHPDQVGHTRGTLWEIHPIHQIEVYSSDRWRDLDSGE